MSDETATQLDEYGEIITRVKSLKATKHLSTSTNPTPDHPIVVCGMISGSAKGVLIRSVETRAGSGVYERRMVILGDFVAKPADGSAEVRSNSLYLPDGFQEALGEQLTDPVVDPETRKPTGDRIGNGTNINFLYVLSKVLDKNAAGYSWRVQELGAEKIESKADRLIRRHADALARLMPKRAAEFDAMRLLPPPEANPAGEATQVKAAEAKARAKG